MYRVIVNSANDKETIKNAIGEQLYEGQVRNETNDYIDIVLTDKEKSLLESKDLRILNQING